MEKQLKKETEINEHEAWKNSMYSWNASIPYVITTRNAEELARLGEIAPFLQGRLAFMKYPEFQTYMNLENITEIFKENPQRGTNMAAKHEIGHRFCPFDLITSIILMHKTKKGLEEKTRAYDTTQASKLVLNLCSDMNINTLLVRKGDEDIPWAYGILCRNKKDKLWKVYGKSMELAWKKELLPKGTKLNKEESEAAENLAGLFEKDYFDRSKWPDSFQRYAEIIGDFLEEEKDGKGKKGKGDGKGGNGGIDDITGNIPKELDDKTATELAKRLAKIGSDGLPSNPKGMEEFKEIMAGFGQGDMKKASINFYEMLSRSYDVMFATKPFGRPRQSPFQPVKWQPSMGADKIDMEYSTALGGKIIPGVTTYTWNTRKREIHGGLEEVVPNLDLYLDSSMSTPNPLNEISLLVLAGFVAAKKAQKKGSRLRATNFSGENQHFTQEWTTDLGLIYEALVKYYNGGTIFPTEKMLEDGDPKQVLIITDTFLANRDKTVSAVSELIKRHPGNRVSVYALHPVDDADYLRNAGAEVIHGTNTDVFKKVIGKAHEVYTK